MIVPIIKARDVRQSALGREEPQHDDRSRTMESAMGVIVAVYPIDHPENGMGQTLVDIQPGHMLPPWRFVPLGPAYAHQETEIASAYSANRQPYAPKPKNRMEGAVYDVRPGTKVRVGFFNGDLRAPYVAGALAFNEQGAGGEKELVGADRWAEDDSGFERVETSPVQSSLTEFPRAVDSFNGTRVVRDNAGNFLLQTTTDQEPVFPGHNGIPAAPKPQGNALISTRGARRGNVGILTGAADGAESIGDVRIETVAAAKGNVIARLASKIGRLWASTVGSDDGRVYLEDKERDYLALRANGRAELHGEVSVILDGDRVFLGHDGAKYEIVLWPQLDELEQVLTQRFNVHGHTLVQTGNSTSGPPNQDQQFYWLQNGNKCRSDVAFADKSASSSPHKEDDPGGGAATSEAEETSRVDTTTDVRGYRTEGLAKGLGANRWVRKVIKKE